MTEEKKSGVLEDLLRYQYAPIAGNFKENPESPQMAGSLELLARDQGVKESPMAGWYKGTMASPQGMVATAEVYIPKWKQAYENATVRDLFDYYSDAKDFKLSKYFSEGQIKLLNVKLMNFKDKKFKDIQDELKKQIESLKKISKGEDKEASDEDIRNANNNKLMYEEAVRILSTFEAMKNQTFIIASGNKGMDAELKKTADNLVKSITG